MAAPDIILVTGKGFLQQYDQRQQNWSQVIPVDGDPENATPVRLLILQNDGFSLKAVHDRNGQVSVILCVFIFNCNLYWEIHLNHPSDPFPKF